MEPRWESEFLRSPKHVRRDAAPEGPPRCKGCGYTLDGLPSPGMCPECGWPFDLKDPTSYPTNPPLVRWRLWLPGLVLAVGGGVLVSLVLAYGFGSWGASLWLAVPFSVGAALGYGLRTSPVATAVFGLLAGCGLILGLMSGGLAGVFCSMVLMMIFLVPIGAGLLAGAMLRWLLKRTSFDQRSYLPAILLLLLPVPLAIMEGPGRPLVIESVSTSRVIDAPPRVVWESLVFYEEVKHRPPLILRLGLARPLHTEGESQAVGDVKVCIYNRGRITKRITEVVAEELLAFEIVEQQIGYERDVELRGGRFVLTDVGDDRTRVELATLYRPLLSPRFAWRWGERYAFRTLHGHVLQGITREAANALARDDGHGLARGDGRQRLGGTGP